VEQEVSLPFAHRLVEAEAGLRGTCASRFHVRTNVRPGGSGLAVVRGPRRIRSGQVKNTVNAWLAGRGDR